MCGSPKAPTVEEVPAKAQSMQLKAKIEAFPVLTRGTTRQARNTSEEPRTPSPCQKRLMENFTPPPLQQQSSQASMPALCKALQMNSLEQVRAALQEEATAAAEPFWEHNFEPPLCCAVRCRCDSRIIQLLLEHGADPHAANLRGKTPLQLLRESERRIAGPNTQCEQTLELFGFSASTHPFNQPGLASALSLFQDHLSMPLWYAEAELAKKVFSAPSTGDASWCQRVSKLLSGQSLEVHAGTD